MDTEAHAHSPTYFSPVLRSLDASSLKKGRGEGHESGYDWVGVCNLVDRLTTDRVFPPQMDGEHEFIHNLILFFFFTFVYNRLDEQSLKKTTSILKGVMGRPDNSLKLYTVGDAGHGL